jgi:hypothetical protein
MSGSEPTGAEKSVPPNQNNALTLTKQKIAYVWILSFTINNPHFQAATEAFAANSNPQSGKWCGPGFNTPLQAVLWIHIGFNADPDPAFNLFADPGS